MSILQIITNPETTASSFIWFDKVSMKFISRFLVDIVSVTILVRFIYYRIYKRTDFFLTFFGFNIVIFLITYLLNKVEMSLGAAFGLFAVFSILRYRTEAISTKDMTYLFMVIAVGLITAISKGSWDDLSIMAGIVLGIIALLESNILIRRENSKPLIYDRIQLISPEKRPEMLVDLCERTGLKVHRVDIINYDFLKDSAMVTIYYYD
jgi:Domain of unknown function (DUF4956)